jgi:hypothetical protein
LVVGILLILALVVFITKHYDTSLLLSVGLSGFHANLEKPQRNSPLVAGFAVLLVIGLSGLLLVF